MNGYFKPNFKNEMQELHELSLDDCEFVTEDEMIPHPVYGRKHVCPRCGSVTRLETSEPYCSDCNWDSLTDSAYENDKCAA